jgi:2-keto-4-pentenoate hydratase
VSTKGQTPAVTTRSIKGDAQAILDAFARHRLIEPLSDGNPALSEDQAYAIAWDVHSRRVERGERPVGRKLGFTNRRVWMSGPFWGHVYDSTVQAVRDGRTTVDVRALLQPRIEPEIQVHFARTPPVTDDENAILACVDWIAQGFEFVQCPFPDWQFKAVDAIAAFAIHGSLVVGKPVAVSGIEDCAAKLRTLTVTLSRDGVAVATGSGSDVLGSPLLACAHLVQVLARQSRFSTVQAGEVVSTGTLTPIFPVESDQTWSTTIDGIELPGLSVTIL